MHDINLTVVTRAEDRSSRNIADNNVLVLNVVVKNTAVKNVLCRQPFYNKLVNLAGEITSRHHQYRFKTKYIQTVRPDNRNDSGRWIPLYKILTHKYTYSLVRAETHERFDDRCL